MRPDSRSVPRFLRCLAVPYLAGVVTNVDGDKVWVEYPGAKSKRGPYCYLSAKVLPFRSQFVEGVFKPIKICLGRPKQYQRRLIQIYEAAVENL